MEQTLGYDDYRAAADAVRAATRHAPRVGVILGSGLGALCDAVEDAESIPIESIPNWPRSTVVGHVGRLVAGRLEGQTVLVQQGRAHYYEGYSLAQATLPVRVLQLLGVPIVIITNAAGGLNPGFRAGELMLIVDHLNLIGMGGQNPLRGPNDPRLGERFPDMSQAYDSELIALARRVAAEQDLRLHSGVYAALAGPSFETPADVRFLRQIGADAVGMSTVPEVIVARHGGLRVLGVSGISNVLVAAGAPGEAAAEPTSHEEVLAAGERLVPQLVTLVRGVLRAL